MKRYKMIFVILALLASSLGLTGCVGKQAFPLAARPGDTVALALGGTTGVHETIPGAQIRLEDLDVSIKQADQTLPVNLRYLFRLYPDLTSRAVGFAGDVYAVPVGEWTLVLDLPSSGLVEGQAEIAVNTSKLHDSGGSYEGDLSNIPVTILPGTGASHLFNPSSSLENLQPLPQLEISFSGTNRVAAVDLTIDYDENVFANSTRLKVMQNIATPDITINQRIYSDNGNQKMRVILMTNKGGNVDANVMKCFAVWDPNNLEGNVDKDTSFTITSQQFYDNNGAPVTGIDVVKTLLYQPPPLY